MKMKIILIFTCMIVCICMLSSGFAAWEQTLQVKTQISAAELSQLPKTLEKSPVTPGASINNKKNITTVNAINAINTISETREIVSSIEIVITNTNSQEVKDYLENTTANAIIIKENKIHDIVAADNDMNFKISANQ